MPNKNITIQKEFPFDKNANIIKGESKAEKIKKGIPSMKQLLEDKHRKPKHLQYCSDETINDLLRLYSRRW